MIVILLFNDNTLITDFNLEGNFIKNNLKKKQW
jgi:hypothetical protein